MYRFVVRRRTDLLERVIPFFERYPEAFDPATGEGGFKIWRQAESRL